MASQLKYRFTSSSTDHDPTYGARNARSTTRPHRSSVAILVGLLLILASCGDGGDPSLVTPADGLDEFFIANPSWEIVERTGFSTSTTGGLVQFFEVETLGLPIPGLGLKTSDCVSGTAAFEWDEESFTFFTPEDVIFEIDTADSVERDLFVFLSSDEPVNVEVSPDGSTTTLRTEGRTLRLLRTP